MTPNVVYLDPNDPETTTQKIALQYVNSWKNQETVNALLDLVVRVVNNYKSSPYLLANELWRLLRAEFQYANDPNGKELLRSPNASKARRKMGIDCEDFAVLVACVLVRLGVPCALRIVQYDSDQWEHIFVVIKDKMKEVVIDPVNTVFNTEPSGVSKRKDFIVKAKMGLGSLPLTKPKVWKMDNSNIVVLLINEFEKGEKFDWLKIKAIAKKNFSINDDPKLKEWIELAIVRHCRQLASHNDINKAYQDIVNFYNNQQPSLNLRTSNSIKLQQYSTPAPLAYLMGVFCKINEPNINTFEPSAGNGMLTIAAKNNNNIDVNEIDEVRHQNLQLESYNMVYQLDGSKSFRQLDKKYRAILTNPPFGKLDKNRYETFGGYEIKDLDHLMSIRALDCMQNDGRAAILVGGYTDFDNMGRIVAGKNRNFLGYLYSHYNVVDVVPIDGKLYAKMGASYPVRLILIDRRKRKPEGYAPLRTDQAVKVVSTFKDLYERVLEKPKTSQDEEEAQAQAQRIRILKIKYKYGNK